MLLLVATPRTGQVKGIVRVEKNQRILLSGLEIRREKRTAASVDHRNEAEKPKQHEETAVSRFGHINGSPRSGRTTFPPLRHF